MARGINKVILIGNLGADPETRAMPSGMTVANIRMATSESWKDKQSGENKERTEWHNVAMFGRLGEIAGEYLKKGSQGLHRRQPAHAQMAGQAGQRSLHHGNHRQRNADARQPRWRRHGRRRWRYGGGGGGGVAVARSHQPPPDDFDQGGAPVVARSGEKGGGDFDDDIPF